MEEDDFSELETEQDVATYLLLKFYNGMKFVDVLRLHKQLIWQIGA